MLNEGVEHGVGVLVDAVVPQHRRVTRTRTLSGFSSNYFVKCEVFGGGGAWALRLVEAVARRLIGARVALGFRYDTLVYGRVLMTRRAEITALCRRAFRRAPIEVVP